MKKYCYQSWSMIPIHRKKGVVVSVQSGREGAKKLIEREREKVRKKKLKWQKTESSESSFFPRIFCSCQKVLRTVLPFVLSSLYYHVQSCPSSSILYQTFIFSLFPPNFFVPSFLRSSHLLLLSSFFFSLSLFPICFSFSLSHFFFSLSSSFSFFLSNSETAKEKWRKEK